MKQYRDIKGIVFCLICFIFVGTLVFTQFIRIQNIFDQMYYTRVRSSYSWWGVGNDVTSFEKKGANGRLVRRRNFKGGE